MDLSEADLAALRFLDAVCDPAPWSAMIEGQDFLSGDSFIQTGHDGDRGEDIYVTRDSGPAEASYLKLIAESRNLLHRLLAYHGFDAASDR